MVYLWSQTAASNSGSDPNINWAEGQSPSSINDSSRAEMSRVAKFRDDISGMLVTGGTSAAYTIASNQGFDTRANFHNKTIYFTPHVTNAAGPITVTVDGFANIPLRSSPGKELLAGTLIQGTPYGALYNNTDGALYLIGLFGNPYSVPLLGGMDYWDTIAPNSSFIFPAGQAISRTTYAAAFARWGTTYGPGDGSTTFNVPDKTERVSVMKAAAASRLTATYFGANSATMGAVGGADHTGNTIVQANLPNITLPLTISLPNFNVPTESGAANLNHGDSGLAAMGPSGGNNAGFGSLQGTPIGSASGTAALGGSGTALSVGSVPPTIVCNYIIRII